MNRVSAALLAMLLTVSLVRTGHAVEPVNPGRVLVVSRLFESSSKMARPGKADLEYVKMQTPGARILMQGDAGYYYDGGVFGLISEMQQGHNVYFEVPKDLEAAFHRLFPPEFTVTSHGQTVPTRGVVQVGKKHYSGRIDLPLSIFGERDFPALPKRGKDLVFKYGARELVEHMAEADFRKAWLSPIDQKPDVRSQAFIKLRHGYKLVQELNLKRSRIVPPSARTK